MMMASTIKPPKIVFIVPYRDREYHLNIFRVMMTHLLEDYDSGSYEIYFAHQADDRPFNRGAMKNIGFLAIKEKYPNTYRDITFVFNDVDTVPSLKGLVDYETKKGVIKHFYGFPYALGGLFSITGQDFELINGFPCYWSWGYEDNVINERALKAGITIDRSTFFKIGNQAILQTVDSYVKLVNRRHKELLYNDDGRDGVNTLTKVYYEFEKKENEPSLIGSFIDISYFESIHKISDEQINRYDMLNKRYIDGPRFSVVGKTFSKQINNANRAKITHPQATPQMRNRQEGQQSQIPRFMMSRGLVLSGK